ISGVALLGSTESVTFTHEKEGVTVKLPASAPCKYAYTLKITGLKMNAPTATLSGNPL
ncbi:MAG: hypothetical protein H7Z43_11405, partial [Clostridia bacterium]|nr:hypothetical protein [Deltaproteobacteria bacterium]